MKEWLMTTLNKNLVPTRYALQACSRVLQISHILLFHCAHAAMVNMEETIFFHGNNYYSMKVIINEVNETPHRDAKF